MKPVVISLFDYTGIMCKPWLDAGYECWIVDLQHPVAYDNGGITRDGDLVRVHADLTLPWMPPREILDRIVMAFGFPVCDHLSISGARWFTGKGLRKLAVSAEMFATCAELFDWLEVPFMIENPVSTMSTYWRKPDHSFHPHFFTGYNVADNYTKKTCLWTGNGFVLPQEFIAEGLGEPDDRIHKAPPSADRHNFRSATPLGFSKAVFEANTQGAILCQ